MNDSSGLYIGLMSGTSADGIDAALVNITTNEVKTLATSSLTYPPKLQDQLLKLIKAGCGTLDEIGFIDIEIGAAFASCVNKLLSQTEFSAEDIVAIGSHGQTVRHQPPSDEITRGFSQQLGSPATICADTGIDVIADFRNIDMAYGGHGAPLAPAFHQTLLKQQQKAAILNLGGIANITLVENDNLIAWDTGPASTLMDRWIQRHRNQAYDDEGTWAASGIVVENLSAKLLEHPYFKQTPPKSTGFETFNLAWLDDILNDQSTSLAPQNVQATLLEFTAQSIADAVSGKGLTQLYTCGGGVNNAQLIKRLKAKLPDIRIETTAKLGVDPQWMEAIAFAWLAWRHKSGLHGNIRSVTGASKEAVLGCLYSATQR